jgi:ATP-dependent helicase/DNAse subunit B
MPPLSHSEEIDQIWNGLIQILDDLVTVFDNEEMTLKRFLEVLHDDHRRPIGHGESLNI